MSKHRSKSHIIRRHDKSPGEKSPKHSYFYFLTLHAIFFQNQVRIFPATFLQISGSLSSRCDSNLKHGGSREVLGNWLVFLNQVRIFPAILSWFCSSICSRWESNLMCGGSREVLVGIFNNNNNNK